MRDNKIFGWDKLMSLVEGAAEQVQKYSPWLSRQILQRASEWPYWYSGVQVKELRDDQVWVHMPMSFRNSLDGEISSGHLLLASELTLRLLLLQFRQEFPFRSRLRGGRVEIVHPVDQAVDFKFRIPFAERERIRLELARSMRSEEEFVFSALLSDGRLAATFTWQVAFDLEKLLMGQ